MRRTHVDTYTLTYTDPDARTTDSIHSLACFRSNRGRHFDHDYGHGIPIGCDCFHRWNCGVERFGG